MNKFPEATCAIQIPPRASSIKASMRAWMDTHSINVAGVAQEMHLDPATVRRYLSDTWPGVLPCDQIHSWYVSSNGDLSPVRHQLHLCGYGLHRLEASETEPEDTPRQAADLSRQGGDAVAILLEQWADGERTLEERRKALPILRRLRAKLDQIIGADESMTGRRR